MPRVADGGGTGAAAAGGGVADAAATGVGAALAAADALGEAVAASVGVATGVDDDPAWGVGVGLPDDGWADGGGAEGTGVGVADVITTSSWVVASAADDFAAATSRRLPR